MLNYNIFFLFFYPLYYFVVVDNFWCTRCTFLFYVVLFITFYFCYCCSLCTRTCIASSSSSTFFTHSVQHFFFAIVVFVRGCICVWIRFIFFKQYLSALKCLRKEEGSGKFLKLSKNLFSENEYGNFLALRFG